MRDHETIFELWNFMEFSKKQQLMQQFRKLHGNHYTKDDFLCFLSDHCKSLKMTHKSLDVKMTDEKSNLQS
jgi:hypothetical protein